MLLFNTLSDSGKSSVVLPVTYENKTVKIPTIMLNGETIKHKITK